MDVSIKAGLEVALVELMGIRTRRERLEGSGVDLDPDGPLLCRLRELQDQITQEWGCVLDMMAQAKLLDVVIFDEDRRYLSYEVTRVSVNGGFQLNADASDISGASAPPATLAAPPEWTFPGA